MIGAGCASVVRSTASPGPILGINLEIIRRYRLALVLELCVPKLLPLALLKPLEN